jgi:hypothetical protein
MILEWLVGMFRHPQAAPDVGAESKANALKNMAVLNEIVLHDDRCDLDYLAESVNSISLNWKKKDTDKLKGEIK